MKLFSSTSFRILALIPVVLIILCSGSFIAKANDVPGHPAPANMQPVSLKSPLKNITSIEGLLVAILNIIMILMVPVIVFFIIYAGFKYVMAQGNASQVEEATRALTYAIIGGVLILGAVAISQIIKSVVDAF